MFTPSIEIKKYLEGYETTNYLKRIILRYKLRGEKHEDRFSFFFLFLKCLFIIEGEREDRQTDRQTRGGTEREGDTEFEAGSRL